MNQKLENASFALYWKVLLMSHILRQILWIKTIERNQYFKLFGDKRIRKRLVYLHIGMVNFCHFFYAIVSYLNFFLLWFIFSSLTFRVFIYFLFFLLFVLFLFYLLCLFRFQFCYCFICSVSFLTHFWLFRF